MSEFEERLYNEIPLARAIGVRAGHVGADRVVLTAPLEPNLNHQRTAFGGSIYSLAVLSCWSLLYETLAANQIKFDYIVIQNGAMEYLEPVDGAAEAEARWDDPEVLARFLAAMKKKGVARVTLKATVRVGATIGATLEGRFVARRLSED